jgi:TolB-like protein
MAALVRDGVFLFEGFRLDRRALFRRDERGVFVPVAIGSRALEVLGVLVGRAGDLVSRDEIIAAVWPETTVEDSNLNMQIAALRRVLDEGRERSCIQTVPRRGCRFAAAMTRVVGEAPINAAALPPGALPPLSDRPSLAVMPFQNMSGDPEQEYFADGMVEEIITALSRIRWLFVIARNSSFTYKGQAIDAKQIGRELGVRYVLEGSVRKAGGRVRIAAQLIDATTGADLWADRFNGSLEDIFELQDQVAVSVAGVIEPTLEAAAIYRLADRPTRDLTAFDLYLRALQNQGTFEKNGIVAALDLLGRAIERDPNYGPALALAGSLSPGARGPRLRCGSGGGPSHQRRSRATGASKQPRRPQCPRAHCLCPRIFRRGHRRLAQVDRSLPHAQSEPRSRLALECVTQSFCR